MNSNNPKQNGNYIEKFRVFSFYALLTVTFYSLITIIFWLVKIIDRNSLQIIILFAVFLLSSLVNYCIQAIIFLYFDDPNY